MISGSTAKQYFEDLKNLKILMGCEVDPDPGREKRTAAKIRGLENVKPGKKNLSRDPVTYKTLKEIRIRLIEAEWDQDLKVLFWGCCLIAFFGSFRIGELLPASSGIFDPLTDLSWADVDWIGSDAVLIQVKTPKANKGAETVALFRIRDKKHFCPVRALQHLKNLNKNASNAPVFARKDGQNFSSNLFASLLNKIRDAAPPLNISGRSFRAGIPSLIESHPGLAADNFVKNWGRWRSAAYQKYMRDGTAQKRWLF